MSQVPLPPQSTIPAHMPASASNPELQSTPSSSIGGDPGVSVGVSTNAPATTHLAGRAAGPSPGMPSTRDQRRPEGAGALEQDSLKMLLLRVDRYCQQTLDRIAPFKLYRWLGLIALLSLFLLRMIILEGFYIIAYVLFIFILNQFILFLQPKDRAALLARAASAANGESGNSTDDVEDTDRALPTLDDEEFRPFVRRLPEFKFWYSSTYATFLAFIATFFKAFDVPVFWPLLLFYFVLLFVATMRRQWLDMKRLKYVPWDIGNKKVYKSDPKRVCVARSSQATPLQNVVAASGRALNPVPTIPISQKKSDNAGPAPSAPQQPNLT